MVQLPRLPTTFVEVDADLLSRGKDPAVVHAAHWPAAPDAPGTPVVCVHGLGGSHVSWMLVATRLARLGPVWAPDLAGFGLTPMIGRSASVADNADLVEGFIRQVAGSQPVLLIGSSMGGHLAATVAAEAPDLLAGLVLVCPAVPPSPRDLDPMVAARFALFTAPLLSRRWLERVGRRLTPAEQVWLTLEVCALEPDSIDPSVLALNANLVARRRDMPHAVSAYLEAWRSLLRRLGPARHAFWQRIDQITAPTLLVSGAHDRLMTPGAIAALAQRRPDWLHDELEHCGHLPMVEDPDGFSDAVQRWFAPQLRPPAATTTP